MQIRKLSLANFRNYEQAHVLFQPGLNILVGENAQGKTNLLEAIELLSTAQSSRSSNDADFIQIGKNKMRIELDYIGRNLQENLSLSVFDEKGILAELGLEHNLAAGRAKRRQITVNGVTYSLLKKLRGRLITVTFSSYDLNLVRGGPAYRRDWIDSVIARVRPSFYEQLSKYQKVVQQRNKLLKSLYESHHAPVRDNDQLDAWSEQVAKYGAHIIYWRRVTLHHLIAKAKANLSLISDQNENLTKIYRCRTLRKEYGHELKERENFHDTEICPFEQSPDPGLEKGIEQDLLYSLEKRKLEELVRGQTLSGPHRDDIIFKLNDKEVTAFASQGQQRSLVLALKLSELDLVKEHLLEPPVLLLDDVLAELDLKRQSLLMAQIGNDMQTVISTTHVSTFNSHWLENAQFYQVQSGTINATHLDAVAR